MESKPTRIQLDTTIEVYSSIEKKSLSSRLVELGKSKSKIRRKRFESESSKNRVE